MIAYSRISIFSRSASSRARGSGCTWKPTMIAPEAAASSTSDSEIWPTAWRMMRICTSPVLSLESDSESASTDPSTSPLMISLSSLVSPWLSWL